MLIRLGLNPSPLGLGLGYKVGDLFLKAVISSWEICSIEVLCGFANIFVQTLPSFKTLVLLLLCLNL